MNPRFSVQGALSNSPLRNAAHLTTSIKGIATLSGFKSKSIFYACLQGGVQHDPYGVDEEEFTINELKNSHASKIKITSLG